MSEHIAIYPGTFDPITNGHLDILERASKIFDAIIIAIAKSQAKSPLFCLEERKHMIELAILDSKKITAQVRAIPFENLIADFAKDHHSTILIRGLRAVSDFEYELQMGYANASLNPNLETIYLMPSLQNAFISSTVVKTILAHKGNISHLVPPCVHAYIKEKHVHCH